MFDALRSVPTPYLLAALVALYVAYKVSRKVATDARIAKLGARAPIRHTYAPLGLDLLYEILTYFLADMVYEFWLKQFSDWSYGRHTLEQGGIRRVILTAEPENIKAILATQFPDYGKGEQFHKEWHPFLGSGVFTTDGALWHDSRQIIRPQFIKERVSDLMIFEENVQILIRKISETPEVNMLDQLLRYTFDVATHFLLGKSAGSMEQPQVALAAAFSTAQRTMGLVVRTGPLNWLVPRKRMGFYRAMDVINNFISGYIDEALALSPEELEKKTSHDSGYTFLHAVASYTRDRKMLRDQIISVMLAGRDTTACTLNWAIYELSLQPHITAKLRREIFDHLGRDRAPTYDDLKTMKYLQHILNETLRLYPSVPYNVRIALRDTTLPTGGGPDGTQPIGILAGTSVAYSTLVMQRRADLYPSPESGFPPVDKFVPERWDHWTPKAWTYIPFNGGPRICIGQQFALTEIAYTLVRLLQRFEGVENRMGGVEAGLHNDIVLQPAKEVRVAFK
ncbi:cytochrome P450 [Massariosphaeria phaeospora]|uniref:Cytochrome P450 n=1 Tax=Massariosphaeria phaeospora TaxID=100035 RepID=A0A7C8IEP2_9PLEO|nr:cytochrome P450 [Massariosphaeria phaeospora]